MYQYKNYKIIFSDFGVYVYSPSGERFGPFVNDQEAEEFVDSKEE